MRGKRCKKTRKFGPPTLRPHFFCPILRGPTLHPHPFDDTHQIQNWIGPNWPNQEVRVGQGPAGSNVGCGAPVRILESSTHIMFHRPLFDVSDPSPCSSSHPLHIDNIRRWARRIWPNPFLTKKQLKIFDSRSSAMHDSPPTRILTSAPCVAVLDSRTVKVCSFRNCLVWVRALRSEPKME